MRSRLTVWRRPLRSDFDRCDPERRASFRYPTAWNLIQLGWWEGDQFFETRGWIANISFSGARIWVDRVPATIGPRVVVRLHRPRVSTWHPARVVWLHGEQQLGVVFDEGGTDDLLRALRWACRPDRPDAPAEGDGFERPDCQKSARGEQNGDGRLEGS